MPLCRRLRCDGHLRAAGYSGPIVALTVHAMAEDRQKCLAAGCNGYATKPIDRKKLLATIAQWVEASPAQEVR